MVQRAYKFCPSLVVRLGKLGSNDSIVYSFAGIVGETTAGLNSASEYEITLPADLGIYTLLIKSAGGDLLRDFVVLIEYPSDFISALLNEFNAIKKALELDDGCGVDRLKVVAPNGMEFTYENRSVLMRRKDKLWIKINNEMRAMNGENPFQIYDVG